MIYLSISHILLFLISIIILESSSTEHELHVKTPNKESVTKFQQGLIRDKRGNIQRLESRDLRKNEDVSKAGDELLGQHSLHGIRKARSFNRYAFGARIRARPRLYVLPEDRPGGYHVPGPLPQPKPPGNNKYPPGSPPYSDNRQAPPGWYDYGYTGPEGHGYDSGRRGMRSTRYKREIKTLYRHRPNQDISYKEDPIVEDYSS